MPGEHGRGQQAPHCLLNGPCSLFKNIKSIENETFTIEGCDQLHLAVEGVRDMAGSSLRCEFLHVRLESIQVPIL